MKKIVPFNNILTFDTDVNQITAISLEHNLEKDEDAISGVFYISGEYKMLNGGLCHEKFNFELPFDIALGSRYEMDSLLVDIDDFRYELVDENKMKVNIDLYIDGEVMKDEPVLETVQIKSIPVDERMDDMNNDLDGLTNEECCEEELLEEEILTGMDDEGNDSSFDTCEEVKVVSENIEGNKYQVHETIENDIKRESDLMMEMIYDDEKDENEKKTVIDIDNTNNILSNLNDEENYVTYKVYRVVDGDTIDSILTKYKVTKEELLSYNENITEVKVGDKLIIPAK